MRSRDTLLHRIQELELLATERLEEALYEYDRSDSDLSFGGFLVAWGFMAPEDLRRAQRGDWQLAPVWAPAASSDLSAGERFIDYAITEMSAGEWYYLNSYFTADEVPKGQLININTPIEFFPGKISKRSC